MKISTNGTYGRFYCPGCKDFHTFFASETNYNGSSEVPTIKPRLVYANNGGQVVCAVKVSDGRMTFDMDSRHRLAGQTVDMPDISGGVPK